MRMTKVIKASVLLVLGISGISQAMPIKSQMIKPRAYFQEADNNLLEPLDLKAKTMSFTKKEFDLCGQNLVRRAKTLTFSCTLAIPGNSKISKLQNIVTGKSRDVVFGGTKRAVLAHVTEDARTITFTTAFDATGVDFELSKFNDDFIAVYAKVAQLIISDALKNQPIRIEVLESR
jgi:hypothetical protein